MKGDDPVEHAMSTRWLRFAVQGQDYAVQIECLREVVKHCRIEPVPGAPAHLPGVINLRGQIVTVLDFRRWLGGAGSAPTSPMLVLDHQRTLLAITVDAVQDIAGIHPQQILPAEGEPSQGWMQGTLDDCKGRVVFIDVDGLLRELLR